MTLPRDLRYLHRLPCRAGDDEGSHAALMPDDTIVVHDVSPHVGRHRDDDSAAVDL